MSHGEGAILPECPMEKEPFYPNVAWGRSHFTWMSHGGGAILPECPRGSKKHRVYMLFWRYKLVATLLFHHSLLMASRYHGSPGQSHFQHCNWRYEMHVRKRHLTCTWHMESGEMTCAYFMYLIGLDLRYILDLILFPLFHSSISMRKWSCFSYCMHTGAWTSEKSQV